MNRRVNAEEDRYLDRARGMKPTIGVMAETRMRLGVVDGDGEGARAGASLESVEAGAERVERFGARHEWSWDFSRGHCAGCRGKHDAE